MSLNIDPINKKLIDSYTKIPKYPGTEDTEFSFSVNAGEKTLKKLPVTIYKSDILIDEMQINGLYIPQILTFVKQAFAIAITQIGVSILIHRDQFRPPDLKNPCTTFINLNFTKLVLLIKTLIHTKLTFKP